MTERRCIASIAAAQPVAEDTVIAHSVARANGTANRLAPRTHCGKARDRKTEQQRVEGSNRIQNRDTRGGERTSHTLITQWSKHSTHTVTATLHVPQPCNPEKRKKKENIERNTTK